MLVWDNSIMGLRDEIRLEGLLIQTWFAPVHQGRLIPTGVLVRHGLRKLNI